MSDCRNGGRSVYRIPEDREPGVLYDHGQPNYDYLQANAIVVGGVRFERVRECRAIAIYNMHDEWYGDECSACGYEWYEDEPSYCPHCGAKVVRADD